MISGKLKDLRDAHHKTQADVAEACGITQSLYGVSIDELFGYKAGKKFVDNTDRICRRLRKYGFVCHQRKKNVIVESYGYMIEVSNQEMERIMNRVFRELRKDTEKIWINLLRDGIGRILVAEYVDRDLQLK